MDKRHFNQLVKGVREMKRHMTGETVRGIVTTELPVPNLRTIRKAVQPGSGRLRRSVNSR